MSATEITHPRVRPWGQSLVIFTKSGGNLTQIWRIFTAATAGYAPLNVLNDLAPIVGQIDDPLLPVNVVAAVYVLCKVWRIRHYKD